VDPLSIILRLCLALAVIGTEILSFFLIVRLLVMRLKSRWLQTVNDAGQPLVDPALGVLDRGLPSGRVLRGTPRIYLALLVLAILRLLFVSI